MLGSEKKGETYAFNTYAPHAKKVELYIGDNNYPMNVNDGIWSTTVEVKDNVVYSYIIDGVRKCDPFARKIIEFNKGNPESVTYNSTYVYKNKKQIREVVKVYEVYLKNIQGKTYQEKTNSIIKDAQGYSHIQIMPFNYTPNKKTLGYKTSTYFAPEPFYGSLDDFKEMIDILHGHGYGVILDFSIFEFEEFSNTGLKMYDGTTLFERADKKQHPIFTGFYFDIEKEFVRNFLKSVVMFLVDDLNVDGIRIDGVNEVVFINKGETQDINEQGLNFIKEILSIVPKDIIIIADMLTHYKLTDLKLERINYVEANMFMFQLQSILNRGLDWFEKNKDKEIKVLYNTLSLIKENKYIATINHDIHIDGIDDELRFGKLKSQEAFSFLKRIVYALPTPKQIYYKADEDHMYESYIGNINLLEFSFNLYENNIIEFIYSKKESSTSVFFSLFDYKISIVEKKVINIQ